MYPACDPTPFDLAGDWIHQAGTRVSVKLSDGRTFEAVTATPAFQMARFAVVELEGHAGTWLVSALTALSEGSG